VHTVLRLVRGERLESPGSSSGPRWWCETAPHPRGPLAGSDPVRVL